MIELASGIEELRPRICVIGVGGAGGNAIANMMRGEVRGVEFIVANTDAQALRGSPAHHIVQLGRTLTQGLGAGSRPELGKAAAEDSLAEIGALLDGAHMCFIAAGMGGGTGSGAAPVIAKAARDKGILTVGVVTKPFQFEGTRRARIAARGLEELRDNVDTLIVIPNQNLFRVAGPEMTFKAAFDLADEVLQQGVRGITDLMTMPGLINLDFADIRTIMADMGRAMMGVGDATGEDRALRAAEQAIANPLLDESLQGAKGLIISITGGEDMRLWEVDEIAGHVRDLADRDADIIWGSAFDPSLAGRIRVSLVATGIDDPAAAIAGHPEERPAADPLAAPVAAPVATPAPAAAVPAAVRQPAFDFAPTAPTDGELLLTVERQLVLTPPEGESEFQTVDPFAAPAADTAPAPAYDPAPARGPSLFERMTMLARAPIDPPPPLSAVHQGRRIIGRPIDQAA